MTAEKRDNIFGAIYRELDELADAVRKNTEALERLAQIALRDAERAVAREPEQPPLPGMPAEDWTPPEIEAKKPREWCNTVRVYDVIHAKCGTMMFSLSELIENAAIQDAIREATGGKVGVASYSKILSVLVRSGVMERHGRFGYILAKEPTDELRESVERTAKKRAAAKEVSA